MKESHYTSLSISKKLHEAGNVNTTRKEFRTCVILHMYC